MENIYLVFFNEEIDEEIAENGLSILLDEDISYKAEFIVIEPNNKSQFLKAIDLANFHYNYSVLSKEEYEKYSGV